jgi:hypothetical protein
MMFGLNIICKAAAASELGMHIHSQYADYRSNLPHKVWTLCVFPAHYWFYNRLVFLSKAVCLLRPFLCRAGYGGNEDLINACWSGHIIYHTFPSNAYLALSHRGLILSKWLLSFVA